MMHLLEMVALVHAHSHQHLIVPELASCRCSAGGCAVCCVDADGPQIGQMAVCMVKKRCWDTLTRKGYQQHEFPSVMAVCIGAA